MITVSSSPPLNFEKNDKNREVSVFTFAASFYRLQTSGDSPSLCALRSATRYPCSAAFLFPHIAVVVVFNGSVDGAVTHINEQINVNKNN